MILEYMDCGSLDDLIKICGRIPESVIAKMTIPVCLLAKLLHWRTK